MREPVTSTESIDCCCMRFMSALEAGAGGGGGAIGAFCSIAIGSGAISCGA